MIHSLISWGSLLCALAMLVSAGSAQAQPVDYFNGFGSFETFDSNAALQFNASNQSTSIPGWIIERVGDFPVSVTPVWENDDLAQNGDRYLLLRSRGGSSPAFSTAKLNFSISPFPLTSGELYELTFWAAGGLANSGVNLLQVRLSNSTRIDFEDPIVLPSATQVDTLDWQEFTMTFIPNFPEVQLNLMALNSNGGSNVYLDNFSLRPVPEPGGALLLAAAAGAVGLRRRRASRECAVLDAN